MRLLKILAKTAVIGVIFYFIFKSIYSNWDQLDFQKVRLDAFYIVLSFIVMQIGWFSTSWSWGKTLEACNYRLPYRYVFVLYFRSMVSKYLPGKLWQIVSCTYMAAKKGVPEGSTVASLVIGQAYSVLSGLALVAGAVAFGFIGFPGGDIVAIRWTAAPILVVLIILTLRPKLIEPMLNWGLRLFKRQEITLQINILTSIGLFMAFLIPWFLFGFSFWLLARGLGEVTFGAYLPFTAILTASTVLGFLAIFAPGGLGVREGLIVVFMTSLTGYPASFSSAVALGYRIITSLIELADFGLTWVIKWDQEKTS